MVVEAISHGDMLKEGDKQEEECSWQLEYDLLYISVERRKFVHLRS